MLEVGNGMKYNEDKAHFSLWCMLAAPLMAGNDLRKMSDQTTAILTNKEIIALDQDPLGIEAFRYYAFDGVEIWVKPLANNELAVCFLNRSDRPQNVSYDWKDHVITDAVSKISIDFNQASYKLRDLWAKKDIGTTGKTFKQAIPADDVVVLRLTKE
jgi:alpha-galactosidase